MSVTPLPDYIGFGTMRTTWTPKPLTQEQANEVFLTAYKAGARFFNGGEFYGGDWVNLKYLNGFFNKYPELKDEIIVAIKGGISLETFQPDGSEKGVERSLDTCLKYLPKIDIFECARVDKSVPIEETISYISKYVKSGQIKGISLSEVSAESIRKAAKVAPISFVELEFSLWARELLSNGVAETCRELNIPIVAYSPLGAGFLTGTIASVEDLPEGDFRRHFDRFAIKEHLDQNKILLEKLRAIAKEVNLSLAQLSLAWIKHFNSKSFKDHDKYPLFVPIPGSTNPERVIDNANVRTLSNEVFDKIQAVLEEYKVSGVRYNSQAQDLLYA